MKPQVVNWMLLIVGGLAIVVEVALGAVTGFDLALLGGSLATGGAVGLLSGSARVGLFAAGGLAFVYLAFFRRMIRARLIVKHTPSNTDAVLGKTGVVTDRIAPHAPGRIKVGDEVWRARLLRDAEGEPPREAGSTVVVESVDGVTLNVR
jgi:membrane protein implicated in regulation of membrane protease activity